MQDSVLQNSRMAEMRPHATHSQQLTRPSATRTILWAGLVAGTLDILDAFVFAGIRDVSPAAVLRYVAGGLLGPQAFRGGAGTAFLGAVCHYSIAFTAATVFYAASRKFPVFTRRPITAGLLYGCLVYAVMNFIVVPLSALPHRPMATGIGLVNGILAILLLVGLPISLIVHRNSLLSR